MSSASAEASNTTVRSSEVTNGRPVPSGTTVPDRIGASSATTALVPLPDVRTRPVVVLMSPNWNAIGCGVAVPGCTLVAPSAIHFEIAFDLRPKIGSSWFQVEGSFWLSVPDVATLVPTGLGLTTNLMLLPD